MTPEEKKRADEFLKEKSRAELGVCKNETCYFDRRHGSAYCFLCSLDHATASSSLKDKKELSNLPPDFGTLSQENAGMKNFD